MTAEQCRERAKACFQMMESAPPDTRETFRQLGESWLLLADEARLYERDTATHSAMPAAKPVH